MVNNAWYSSVWYAMIIQSQLIAFLGLVTNLSHNQNKPNHMCVCTHTQTQKFRIFTSRRLYYESGSFRKARKPAASHWLFRGNSKGSLKDNASFQNCQEQQIMMLAVQTWGGIYLSSLPSFYRLKTTVMTVLSHRGRITQEKRETRIFLMMLWGRGKEDKEGSNMHFLYGIFLRQYKSSELNPTCVSLGTSQSRHKLSQTHLYIF